MRGIHTETHELIPVDPVAPPLSTAQIWIFFLIFMAHDLTWSPEVTSLRGRISVTGQVVNTLDGLLWDRDCHSVVLRRSDYGKGVLCYGPTVQHRIACADQQDEPCGGKKWPFACLSTSEGIIDRRRRQSGTLLAY